MICAYPLKLKVMEIMIQKLNEIELLLKRQINSTKEILTLDEASEFLQLSKSCLYKMTSKRQIPYYNPGGKKIYFKRADLLEWIARSINASAEESQFDTESYLGRNLNTSKK